MRAVEGPSFDVKKSHRIAQCTAYEKGSNDSATILHQCDQRPKKQNDVKKTIILLISDQ